MRAVRSAGQAQRPGRLVQLPGQVAAPRQFEEVSQPSRPGQERHSPVQFPQLRQGLLQLPLDAAQRLACQLSLSDIGLGGELLQPAAGRLGGFKVVSQQVGPHQLHQGGHPRWLHLEALFVVLAGYVQDQQIVPAQVAHPLQRGGLLSMLHGPQFAVDCHGAVKALVLLEMTREADQ